MRYFRQAVQLLPDEIKQELMNIPESVMASVREVRLRAELPVSLTVGDASLYICGGNVTAVPDSCCMSVTGKALEECVKALCRYSLHAFSESIAHGFIPLPGGHRAGVCGFASVRGGDVISVSGYTSLNIRIARDITGAANELAKSLAGDGTGLLIAGAPLSGKTTVLRDLCRLYSAGAFGKPLRVAVIDEREELFGAVSRGEGFFRGYNTDVLSSYPKSYGIELALRTLSPQIIVLDEIGGEEEARAVCSGVNSGVCFTASVHAGSVSEMLLRPQVRMLLKSGAFKKIVLLDGARPCGVKEIHEVNGVL